MRIVLECAAQVKAKADAACDGSEKELQRLLNATEYDVQDTLIRLSKGRIEHSEIHDLIVNARKGIDQHETKRPKRVTRADLLNSLPYGNDWYDHLSEAFCHSDISALAGASFYGGVVSINSEADELAFAIHLDYLTEQTIRMAAGYGFLLIAINGENRPFNDARDIQKNKRSATQTFQVRIPQQVHI